MLPQKKKASSKKDSNNNKKLVGEKLFVNHLFNKGLVVGLNKELSILWEKKILRWVKCIKFYKWEGKKLQGRKLKF